MTIDIKDPADITTPAAGTVELFLDSTNNNRLSYMDSNRTVTVVGIDETAEAPADIQKSYWASVTCAFNKGKITATEFQAIVKLGFNTVASSVTDDAGNTTTTINAGSLAVAVDSVDVTPNSPAVIDLSSSPTVQLAAAVLPANASDDRVIWVSADVTKATVDQDGLVTGVAVGTAVIRAYSVSDQTISDSVTVTVQA